MPTGSVDPLLVGVAAQRVVAGGIRTAFLDLLADGTAPEDAAIAVCVAVGSSIDEAVARQRDCAGLWDELEPGEEADGIDFLIETGYFEPDVIGDERQQAARASLHAALRSVPALPSGSAMSVFTKLRTGRLAEAFFQLECLGKQRWPSNTSFWDSMRRAGEILGVGSERVQPAD